MKSLALALMLALAALPALAQSSGGGGSGSGGGGSPSMGGGGEGGMTRGAMEDRVPGAGGSATMGGGVGSTGGGGVPRGQESSRVPDTGTPITPVPPGGERDTSAVGEQPDGRASPSPVEGGPQAPPLALPETRD